GAHAQRRRQLRARHTGKEGVLIVRRLVMTAMLCFLVRPAQASVDDYLGKTISEVHVRSIGTELRDPVLAEIVETKAGTPLTMADVRETLAHLFGLGRYQNIEV